VAVTAGDITSTAGSGILALNGLAAANSGTIDVTLTAGRTVTANSAGVYGIRTDSGQSTGTTTINVNGTINAGAVGVRSISTLGDIVTNVSATGVIDPVIGVDQVTVSGRHHRQQRGPYRRRQHRRAADLERRRRRWRAHREPDGHRFDPRRCPTGVLLTERTRPSPSRATAAAPRSAATESRSDGQFRHRRHFDRR
jgi:hypothetical protein